ncbi:MAG TPA: hypothetical protein VFW96_08885 [Thermomicrobiales bacterium]|nr:hypothetical protein [Thermomicrobiales bacterium]
MGADGGPEIADLAGEWRLVDDNPNEWEWVGRARRRHDLAAWLPVRVPSSVQEALWRAGRLAHPYRDLRSRAAERVEHRDWIFGRHLAPAPPPAGRRACLVFDAVADACDERIPPGDPAAARAAISRGPPRVDCHRGLAERAGRATPRTPWR